MGGTPWKGRGCEACKKRKKRCDLQRPQCRRCLKSGMTCPGYSQGKSLFLMYNVNEESGGLIKQRNAQDESQGRSLCLPPSIPGHAQTRMQFYASFLNSYYPMNTDLQAIGQVDSWFQLVSAFVALPTKTRMLDTSIGAISCIYFASKDHNKRLLCQGLQFYNAAIRQMARQIAKGSVTDDVIYTAIVFKGIETFSCPIGERAIFAHMNGFDSLLKQSSCTQANNLMRPIYRLQKQWVMYALLIFKNSIHELDYLKRYSDDRPFDELFEIYIGILSLVASADSIDSVSRPDRNSSMEFLQRCLALRTTIEAWYSDNLKIIGGPPISCSTNTWKYTHHVLPSPKGFFDHFYNFNSITNAERHIFYWKAMLIVQILIYQARVRVLRNTPSAAQNAHESVPTSQEARYDMEMAGSYADKISRAMPFLLQDSMGSYGGIKITVNLHFVFKAYTHLRSWEKFSWVRSISQIVSGQGIDLAMCISQVWWKSWFLCQDPMTNFYTSLVLEGANGEHVKAEVSEVSRDLDAVSMDATEMTESDMSSESPDSMQMVLAPQASSSWTA